MRPLELAIFLLDLACVILPLLARPSGKAWRWLAWLSPLACITMGVQLVVERYRWQMVSLYALTIVLLGLRLPRLLRSTPGLVRQRRRRAWAGGLAGVLVLVVAAAPLVLFPVPRLPAPGGPYAIGTVTFQWTDPTRPEIYTDDPNDVRTIMVQMWYPATPAPGAHTAPWMDRLDVAGPTIARFLGLPSFFLDHVGLVNTNSYPNAPLNPVEGPYPVVIYSHGWNGFRTVNLNQSEALASHGYIAVAVDHTFGAMLTVFPDGRVAPNNPAALPPEIPKDAYDLGIQKLEATYAADLRFVLDQLALVNSGAIPSPLTARLDLARVGLYGHSTGGGAVVIACSQDKRCRAGLGMDAWLEPVPPPVIAQGLSQPFLFMRSEVWATAKNDALLNTLFVGAQTDAYRMTIRGTKHNDFSMLPLLTPLAPALGLKGPIDGQRGMAIITSYLLAFFDHTLKGQARPLLDGPSPSHPEVTFERR
jgi:predicted dienelactone hydrolase